MGKNLVIKGAGTLWERRGEGGSLTPEVAGTGRRYIYKGTFAMVCHFIFQFRPQEGRGRPTIQGGSTQKGYFQASGI